MKQRKLKKGPCIILGIIVLIIILILSSFAIYKYQISPVSNDSSEIEFTVEQGSNFYSIGSLLEEKGLIRSEFFYKLYLKFNDCGSLKAGTYKLRKNMSVSQIVKLMSESSSYNPDAINITFKEGKNMRYIAATIAEYTNNTEDDVFNLLDNSDYLNSLINEYWFINEEILNNQIYYSLEGYLYPNTYEFMNKNVTVEEIFKVMLDETDKKLNKYKKDLENSSYTVHEILTLASIVELEGANSDDRSGVAGVFYNRLNAGWSLGSDVTTYYAAKIEMSERDLYQYELNDANSYNTRSNHLAGKLPVGPICNPSINSIVATLYPESHDYYYFVADKNKKTYFTKTNSEHLRKKQELIEAGLWYTYE